VTVPGPFWSKFFYQGNFTRGFGLFHALNAERLGLHDGDPQNYALTKGTVNKWSQIINAKPIELNPSALADDS
jgi:hypothetical protein